MKKRRISDCIVAWWSETYLLNNHDTSSQMIRPSEKDPIYNTDSMFLVTVFCIYIRV